MAGAPTIKYYYKQDTNQILVSGSDNKDGMNAMLTSSKDALNIQNTLVSAKIKSIGQAIEYQSTAVYNTSSTEGFSIPIAADQELWVYRGIQPPNMSPVGTPPDAGMGDSNNTQYNQYLHRPYKLYLLTQTGSGIPTKPWLPFGNFINESTQNSGPTTQNVANAFDLRQIDIVGNLDFPNNNFLVSKSKASGSFEVYGGARKVHPWIYTRYDTLGQPPVVGSTWTIYNESLTYKSFETAYYVPYVSAQNPGVDSFSINGTGSGATKVYIDSNLANNNSLLLASQSIVNGKSPYIIKFDDYNGNSEAYQVSAINTSNTSPSFYTLDINTPTSSGDLTAQPAGTPFTASLEGASLVFNLTQQQNSQINFTPFLSSTIKLSNYIYSYTSSTFDVTSTDGTAASGSCQFGLWCEYDNYVQYLATVDQTNSGPVRVTYTGSQGVPNFYDIQPNTNVEFVALVGTPSASGDDSQSSFSLEVVNNTTTATTIPPVDVFESRIQDAYVSFSSSITNSLDGLYIFNQIPNEDIQVTASMFVNAWTGSDPGAAKYGDTDVTYSISPDPPLYGAGEAGDKPTWQTCSINIYKGNFPDTIPTITDTPLHTEQFKDADIHLNGLAITTSFVIPSQSINFKDCIRLSLEVTSSQFDQVTSSLVVQEYYMEFNNTTASEAGDGRVPTFIDNAFKGTGGFSNAPDCQPMLNNVYLNRDNGQIQLIEYFNNPYEPSNFQRILTGSAEKSSVPSSNYTTVGWDNSRYTGAETKANDVNSLIGAVNTFGDSPVIDYKRAYIAYCDQVLDPYPVLNRATQFNLKFLINEGGDALNPRVSDYAAFDVEGTWDEDGLGRVGVNQISGSSQYDQLNGYQITTKVAKEPVPIMYSQISATTASSFIPIAGNASHIAVVTSSYIEYGTTIGGSNNLAALDNIKDVNYHNLTQGVAKQNVSIFPQADGLFNSTQFFITRSNQYAVSSSNAGEIAGVVESPIITSSIPVPYTPPGNVVGTQYYGNPGEVFFTTDPIGSGSTPGDPDALSDQYQIRGTFNINATAPSVRKTFKHYKGSGKKTKYSGGNVGSFDIWFESTVSDDLSLLTANWTKEPWDWQGNSPGNTEPTVTFHLGGKDTGIPSGETVTIPNSELTTNETKTSTNYFFQIEENTFKNRFSQTGKAYNTIQYITFNFNFESQTQLKANRRYRFGGLFGYRDEDESAGEDHNFWNPTRLPTGGEQSLGGGGSDTTFIQPPPGGPLGTLKVYGNQEASNLVNNALNFPYWEAITSGDINPNAFLYDFDEITGSGYPPTQTDPGAFDLRMNNQSGSLRGGTTSTTPISSINLVTGSTTSMGISAPISTTGHYGYIYGSGPYPWTTDGDGYGAIFFLKTNPAGTKIDFFFTPTYSRLFKVGDTVTISSTSLELAGFGTNITSDLVGTVTSEILVGAQQGASQISFRNQTTISGKTISGSVARVANAIAAGNNPPAEIFIQEQGNANNRYTGSLTAITSGEPGTDPPSYWIADVTPSLASNNQSPQNPFQQNDQVEITFNTGSVEGVTLVDNEIQMVSPTGNENYGFGYYQGYLAYEPSVNPFFPGGMEPQDTAWPLPNIPWEIQIGDEIRFENNEALVYKIIGVMTPAENMATNQEFKLKLTLAGGPNGNGSIQPSVNIQNFLIRRYRYSPNTVIIDYPFPYGPLPTVREFVPTTDIETINEGGQAFTNATGSNSISSVSGSFINYVKPLLKSDNTPTGILLPEFPVDTLKIEPDEVIRDLRDKKLIE
jgi:hypothetical protein